MAIRMPNKGLELVSGFCAGTKVSDGEALVDIQSINKSVRLSQPEMFAFNNQMDIINTHLVSTVEDYSSDIWVLDLSNGLHLECVDTTTLFDMNLNWRCAGWLKPGDKLVGAVVDGAGLHGEPFHVVKSYRKSSTLAEPVYYFEAEHHNMLLPHFDEGKGKLTFICTHQ